MLELASGADDIAAALAEHPQMLRLVQARKLDTAIRRRSLEVSAALEAVERMASLLRTRRSFEEACLRVEYLCDHPPAKGLEPKWLADLQRYDLVIRRACQESPDLALPSLLRERAERAAGSVEAATHVRRRFWTISAVAAVVSLAAITAGVGFLVWKRSEYAGAVTTLGRRVAEARLGAYLSSTPDVTQILATYGSDHQIAALAEDFAAAVTAEKARAADFQKRLAAHGAHLEELTVAVGERRADGEQSWLDAWPDSFVAAAVALTAARTVGGLPANRGGDAEQGVPAPAARKRMQDEEDALARAEARQADLDRQLARLATESYDRRVRRLQDRLSESLSKEGVQDLQLDVRQLRALAAAPKAEGLPPGASGQRVPAEALGTLDAIEARLEVFGRQEASQ
jgi:hypothetical protein